MELLIAGMFIGIALLGAVWFGVWLKQKNQQPAVRTSDTTTQKEIRQRAKFEELQSQYYRVTTREEHLALKRSVEQSKSQLSKEGFETLLSWIDQGIQVIDAAEAQRIAFMPKLEELRRQVDGEDAFAVLHAIFVTNKGLVPYDEFEQYTDTEEFKEFEERYDQLLLAHFRQLLIAARSGNASDYQKVEQLWSELKDYSNMNAGIDEREDFVEKYLANEWNEMIVRCKQELDWEDDLFTLDDFSHEWYQMIAAKAREGSDFFSLRIAVLLHDDHEFLEALSENVMNELRSKLEVQRAALMQQIAAGSV